MQERNSKQLVSQDAEKTNETSFSSTMIGRFWGGWGLSTWQSFSSPADSKSDQVSSFFKEMAWGLFFKLPVLPKIYNTEKRAEELIEISKAERGAYSGKKNPDRDIVAYQSSQAPKM
jgi:hypothetical protein